jgi:hypothetical protein
MRWAEQVALTKHVVTRLIELPRIMCKGLLGIKLTCLKFDSYHADGANTSEACPYSYSDTDRIADSE